MLYPRIIPCLLVSSDELVKTIGFKDPTYVGDPINAVKIFNEKKADELIVLDIDASVDNVEPNYDLISKIAVECRMPLCYGGGIKSLEQAERIVNLGVEKVALSSAAVENPSLVKEAANALGGQSVVVVLDVAKDLSTGNYEIWTKGASNNTRRLVEEFVTSIGDLGAGEIVINSIDRDGKMNGYDMQLVKAIKDRISIPMTIVGGAGSHDDIAVLFKNFGIIGASAGSMFVFKGPYRAVLISYPTLDQKLRIIS